MIDGIVRFFQRYSEADLFQIKHCGFWTSTWTTLAHNAAGASSIAEHCARMRADGLRHAERVDLIYRGERFAAVVVTDLPIVRQTVARLADGQLVNVQRLVETETLRALMRSLPNRAEEVVSSAR